MSDPPTAVTEELKTATEEYIAARDAVAEYGRETLNTVADQHQEAQALLLEYEDKATDTGREEFVNFARFKHSFSTLVENLPEELPARSAFEQAHECIDKRRLSEDDFVRAREALSPAAELAQRLDRLDTARSQLITTRRQAEDRITELEDRIEHHERLLELGTADFDAPIEQLRDPIDRYNQAVAAGFDTLRSDWPARRAFRVLDRATYYPLVPISQPPAELREYVETTAAGDQSITTLLAYLDYSRSKLAHYVDDATAFRRHVATNRTYLEELTVDPLQIEWPPPPADRVAWRVRELRAVGSRFLSSAGIAALRDLTACARNPETYQRLRDAAIATEQLDKQDRQRIADGTIETELSQYRTAKEEIEAALADAPDP